MVSNESTPLSGHNSTSSSDALSKFAQNVFTKENIEKAGQVAKEKASELHRQAQDGDYSLRFLALLGGILILFVSGLSFVGKILTLNIVGALFELYAFLLGALVLVLEGKQMFLPTNFVNRIHKYALFLKFLWGRGCLYFIAGSLQLSQMDLLNYISGGYMCFVGGLYVFVGQRTAYKLKAMRKTLYSEQTLRTKFHEAGTDGDGALDITQFRGLAESLGLDLTRRETEAAFAHLHKADNEKLSYQEFQSWWTSTAAEDSIEVNAFTFV
jgi:hypothetical protein